MLPTRRESRERERETETETETDGSIAAAQPILFAPNGVGDSEKVGKDWPRDRNAGKYCELSQCQHVV